MDLIIIVKVYVVVVIIICFAIYRNWRISVDVKPYRSRRLLLSTAEIAFYNVLKCAVPEYLTVVAKVRIADLLSVRRGMNRSSRKIASNKIIAKHIDFVLCDSSDMSIVAAVELDDDSHNLSERMQKRAFVDSAFRSAEIPLIRFESMRQYNLIKVSERLQQITTRDGTLAASRADRVSKSKVLAFRANSV